MRRVCVFCGSRAGLAPEYLESARGLGAFLARNGYSLVYGGGQIGLMGAVADAALAEKGEVIGVIPKALARKEVAHFGLTELRVVESMHDRKAMMAELADGFVGLPGGFGTMEEFCEILTWAQLGIHGKPRGLLNARGYFDRLLEFFNQAVAEGFLRDDDRDGVLVGDEPEGLLRRMEEFVPAAGDKWIGWNER